MKRRKTKSMFINAFTEREYRVSHREMNKCLREYEKLLSDVKAAMVKRGLE